MWLWLLAPLPLLLYSPSLAVSQLTGLPHPSIGQARKGTQVRPKRTTVDSMVFGCPWWRKKTKMPFIQNYFTSQFLHYLNGLNVVIIDIQKPSIQSRSFLSRLGPLPGQCLLFFSSSLWGYKITVGEKDHEIPALQLLHDAVKLQEKRQGKFDSLDSRMMKDYVNNHSGKIKRSRMWAPPLRLVLCFTLKYLSSAISYIFSIFIHVNPY